jgi:predicted enzyme related to lactoylglutathione lyase
MTNKSRVNCFDFIEFPAKTIDDLKKAKAFYQDIFGWSYKDWGEDYSDTTDSGLGSGINADPSHRSRHPLAVIYAADLEAVRTKVLSGKGKITRDIFSFPGGRRFNFLDPSGNELAVWSDI